MNGIKLSIALVATIGLMGCATCQDMPFPFSNEAHSNVESVEICAHMPEANSKLEVNKSS